MSNTELDLPLISEWPERRPLRSLPEQLSLAENVSFVFGEGAHAAIELALCAYSRQADLLALMNLGASLKPVVAPDLLIHADSDGRAAHRVVAGLSACPMVRFVRYPELVGVSCPLIYLLATAPTLRGWHAVYLHTFDGWGLVARECSDHSAYIGLTRRGWRARWAEHLAAANAGSQYLFHAALRARLRETALKTDNTPIMGHELVVAHLPFDVAMDCEERLVARFSLHPRGLNMIPGGHAGLRYLGKHGYRPQRSEVSNRWERRHLVLRDFVDFCDREGRPNPLIAARWGDDAYAASVICANPNNFTLQQVRDIRFMEDAGQARQEIARQLRCPVERVSRLLSGRTYGRVI